MTVPPLNLPSVMFFSGSSSSDHVYCRSSWNAADRYSDQLALLTHTMSCIDRDDWMTDVLHFKTSMHSSAVERASSAAPPLKYYAAVV
jgi:hypothetical protein